MSKNRVLLSLAAFAVGFLLCASVLHLVVPSPLDLHAEMRSEKLYLLQTWQGKADAAVFGSSHVHNGFDPRSFDKVLAESSFPERTINMGLQGGAQTEQRELALRFVRQLRPVPGLQDKPLVLLELNAGANLTNDHLMHPRTINLYDWSTVRFAWGLVAPTMGWRQSVGRRGYALVAWLLHVTNFGMVSSRIFPVPLARSLIQAETADDRRGFLSLEPATGRQASMAAEIVKYAHVSEEHVSGVLLPANRALAEELQRNSANPQLQVVYFITPKLGDMQSRTAWPACIDTKGGPVPILSMNRPDLYPELYRDAANWADDAHLTENGAAVLSRAMAETLLRWEIQGKGAAPSACGV